MPCIFIKPTDELVDLPTNSNLTALAEFKSSLIPFSCRVGACGACVIEVLEGISNLTKANQSERDFLTRLGYPELRYRLACRCRLKDNITIKSVIN
ncbi:MAG: 2Fe-2S iron-sulfur cluster-binding protein [Waterburya sp.]